MEASLEALLNILIYKTCSLIVKTTLESVTGTNQYKAMRVKYLAQEINMSF